MGGTRRTLKCTCARAENGSLPPPPSMPRVCCTLSRGVSPRPHRKAWPEATAEGSLRGEGGGEDEPVQSFAVVRLNANKFFYIQLQ
jgi:hypothetical protein